MPNAKCQRLNEGGQSLFEVVVAIGMMTAILAGIVSLAAMAIRNSSFAKNKTLASRYVQEAVEWLRTQRDNDFAVFQGHVQALPWCLIDLSWSKASACDPDSDYLAGTRLLREVRLEGADPISATVRVYWADSQGSHEVQLVTYFTDWRGR